MSLPTHILVRSVAAVTVAVGIIGPVAAQAPAQTSAPQSAAGLSPEAKQAVERGIKYLRSRQHDKGNWIFEREVAQKDKTDAPTKFQDDPTFNLGVTALVALAMVENGVLPSDPAIQRAYNYIKEEAANNKRTYNLGLTILFLTRLGSREDRPLVQRLARRLMLGQFDSGGWSYECPTDADRETSRTGLQAYTRKSGVGDNSNTQFGVMGLWAASRAGAQVDESLELVAKRFRDSQAETGGWDYQSTGKGDSNAMTTAGVYALTVAAAAAGRKAASTSGAGTKARSTSTSPNSAPDAGAAQSALTQDPAFQKGLTRVEQFVAGIGPGISPYFLWSVERLGVTLQMPRFGEVDWYAKGTKVLVESQRQDGSWELAWKGVPDTAFSLLFLRKANLGRDISYALKGESSKPFVLLGQGQAQAFAKLADVVAAAADGDVIEILGNGPFDAAGVSFADKSLIIRGGEGFEPTLVHKLRPLQEPARDPNLRYLLGAKAARLTLEGLRIQMDPNQSGQVAWTSVSLDGGELRAVNCNFTQSNSASVTGIELRGGARLELRNCMFAGFSRAVDAVVTAKQELTLENCLIYSHIGVQAQNPDLKQPIGVTVNLTHNTFHVADVLHLGSLFGLAEFATEANIFHTSAFSSQLRPASVRAPRKWDGRRNLFDLSRWAAAGGEPIRDIRDLDTWRKFWGTKEEESFTRSAPFAVNHQLGPFRHNTNPNDWRLTVESQHLSRNLGSGIQIGCDSYLVGAGQAYHQFKESIDYDEWKNASSIAAKATSDRSN